jgi:hypothetical protein
MLKIVFSIAFMALSALFFVIFIVRIYKFNIKSKNDPFFVLFLIAQATGFAISNLSLEVTVLYTYLSIFVAGMATGLYLANNPLLKKA